MLIAKEMTMEKKIGKLYEYVEKNIPDAFIVKESETESAYCVTVEVIGGEKYKIRCDKTTGKFETITIA